MANRMWPIEVHNYQWSRMTLNVKYNAQLL